MDSGAQGVARQGFNELRTMAGECEGATEEDSGISVAVLAGIIMAVLASTASNLGVNVQKYSFIKESEEVGGGCRSLRPRRGDETVARAHWKRARRGCVPHHLCCCGKAPGLQVVCMPACKCSHAMIGARSHSGAATGTRAGVREAVPVVVRRRACLHYRVTGGARCRCRDVGVRKRVLSPAAHVRFARASPRIGMAMVIFGALGDFVAFALAPQTVVTPVGSFTLGVGQCARSCAACALGF